MSYDYELGRANALTHDAHEYALRCTERWSSRVGKGRE